MHVLISALHRPSRPTGVCRHAANLAQCLADTVEVSKVTLLVGKWQREYFSLSFSLASPTIEIVEIDIKNTSLSRNLWFLFELPKLANSLRPDVVHMSFPFPFMRKRFKSTVVSTIHDLYPYECPENFGKVRAIFNRLFLRRCISNSDGLSCVSKVTLKSLTHYFPHVSGLPTKSSKHNAKTGVVYNYVDFSNVSPRVPETLNHDQPFPFILSVAQHRKNKNIDLLIRAFQLLLKQRQLLANSRLIVVGSDGPETENIKDLINELSLQSQVCLLSAIDDDELCWLYKNCICFIAPSAAEGFCLPLAEALHFSDTIVCSDIPILREIGTGGCTYFDLGQNAVENLHQAIAQTINRSTHQSADLYYLSKQHAAEQYLSFYQALLKDNRT